MQVSRDVVDPELAAAVHRLAAVRAERRALETEEALLRDLVWRHVEHWPPDAFPWRAGAVELRRQVRGGRVEDETALAILDEAGLLAAAPRRFVVNDAEAARFGERLDALRLGAGKRRAVADAFDRAVTAVPQPDADWLAEQARAGRLTPEQYRACFAQRRPQVVVLTVR